MLIILHGENSFFSRRKLDEIIAQYKAKHQSGLSFFVFDEESDVVDVKAAYDTASLFEEKKLIVLKHMLLSKHRALLREFLERKKAKENKDTVLLFYETDKINADKNKDIKWFFEKPVMIQESKPLAGSALSAWVQDEARTKGGKIEYGAIHLLLKRCGGDLWRLANEIEKLVSYDKNITQKSIALLVREPDAMANVFYGIDALVAGDAAKSARHFYVLLRQGERQDKMMGAIMFQFRNMIQASDLLARNVSGAELGKRLRMKPFVLQKTLIAAKKYTPETLKRVYAFLLEADVALKTGGATFENTLWRLQKTLKNRAESHTSADRLMCGV